MGNKLNNNAGEDKSGKNPNLNSEQNDPIYFYENPKTNTENKNNKIKLEHNPLISENNSDPLNKYDIIKELGRGSYAVVRLVKHKLTGDLRAMKTIRRINSKDDIDIINEINILMKLDHPNIVKIFEFYVTDLRYYLITEYCPGGSLFTLIKGHKGPFTEIETSYIMHQLFSVVNYCHKMKIIHRDLKPENILINKNENGFLTIKVCDFGTSLSFNRGDIQKQLVGSVYYMAPEVIKKKYNLKCDIWSCGVIMYILLTGGFPFQGSNKKETFNAILSGEYDKSRLGKRCRACVDLIGKTLEKNIDKRIRADEALEHKWFSIYKSKEIRIDIEDPKVIEKHIINLTQYKKSNGLIELLLAYLIHNHPNLDEINLAAKIFEKIDIKGNGKIKKEEFYLGLSSFYSNENLKNDVDKIFENKMYIDCEEFIKAAVDKNIFLSENLLKFAFDYLDKREKGEINEEDIYTIVKETNLNREEIEEFKKIVEENKPFNFKAFCGVMKNFLN